MAKQGDLSARIRKIQKSLERARTEFAPDAVIGAEPMRKAIGFTWVKIREWIDDHPELERPEILVRGGMGIEWQFRPVPFLEALIACFEADAAGRRQRNQRIQKQAGLTLPEAEAAASFEETKGLVGMTLATFAANERMGVYVVAEEEAKFWEGLLETLVNSIMGVTTAIDPNGGLPPELRAHVDDHLRGIANAAHRDAAAHIARIRAGIQQGGTGASV